MDIDYSKYRKRVFIVGLLFVITTCIIELAYFFGYYYSHVAMDTPFKYLLKNLIIPSVFDVTVYLVCFYIAKKSKKELVKNIASIVMMAVPASLITIIHYAFPQLGLIMAIPLILCSMYGYKNVGNVLLLVGLGSMGVAYVWSILADKNYAITTMMYIISIVLYLCVYTAFWIVNNNNRDKIKKIFEFRNKQDEFVERLKYDSLTNLYNNAAIKTFLRMVLADNININAAVVMIDIDDFKHCNDSYGHVFGDKVLVTLAKCIKKHCNNSVLGSRYGGEEFAIVFIDKTRDEILSTLNEIKQEFQEIFKERNITFSAGVAFNSGKYNSELEFIDAADKLLYKVKNNNKDDILLD